jgi:aminopeptidase N
MKYIVKAQWCIVCLLFILCPAIGRAQGLLPVYTLSVGFDLERNLLRGRAVLDLKEDTDLNIPIDALNIVSVTLNKQPVRYDIRDGIVSIHAKGILEIRYEAVFDGGTASENAGAQRENTISDKGIYLGSKWYPSISGTAFYQLKALIPEGFTAISEADEITVTAAENGKEFSFNFPHPLQGISLVAGRYVEKRETFDGIDIYSYFFPEDGAHARKCTEHSKRYLSRYKELLSPYPYKRFSCIENFLSAGYSTPTLVVLDRAVVHPRFAAEQFLNREIVRQWFGNRVYSNVENGDWAEGLTSYLAEERMDAGWRVRKNLMLDYEDYVTPLRDFPLQDFHMQADPVSGMIGRGKGAMLFHMLKNYIEEESFFAALKALAAEKEFQEITWDDLQSSFESSSGKQLEWFFSQWLTRKGMPSIEIRNPRVMVLKGEPTVLFDIVQNGETYILNLPVMIKTDKGEVTERLNIERKKESFEIPVRGNPLEMAIDAHYDVFRRLSKEERPPVLSGVLTDDEGLIVLPGETETYADLVAVFRQKGFAAKGEDDVQDEDIKTHSLVVFGRESPVLKRLFGNVEKTGSGFTMTARRNPLNTARTIAIAHGDSKSEVELASQAVFNYGGYSFVRFEKGKNVEKLTDETEQGIRISLYEPVTVIQPGMTKKLDDIIDAILKKPIIYIGERHTNYEDHKVQLKVIMSLHEKGRKFAIGMEMFQRPFQRFMNEYLAGNIGEREFLKRTEYFKRWQFDYNLYREIIEYARAKNIPVIALNLWAEIIRKVAMDGLDGLTQTERGELPASMDMSDEAYRERLEEAFKQHRNHENKNFDNFYQSQILWDETMAYSIDEFLGKNPGYQMVVLAGTGHIMYDSGIPQRAFRLNSREYATIIPWAESIDEGIADYLFAADPVPAPPTLKLGVVLKEKDGRLGIDTLVPGSIAKNAGLEKGDILLSLDEWKIEDIADVAIFLVNKKRGDTVRIKVLRKGFFSGYKELEFAATM